MSPVPVSTFSCAPPPLVDLDVAGAGLHADRPGAAVEPDLARAAVQVEAGRAGEVVQLDRAAARADAQRDAGRQRAAHLVDQQLAAAARDQLAVLDRDVAVALELRPEQRAELALGRRRPAARSGRWRWRRAAPRPGAASSVASTQREWCSATPSTLTPSSPASTCWPLMVVAECLPCGPSRSPSPPRRTTQAGRASSRTGDQQALHVDLPGIRAAAAQTARHRIAGRRRARGGRVARLRRAARRAAPRPSRGPAPRRWCGRRPGRPRRAR